MKNFILLLFALGLSFSLFGQSNRNGISYQALITSPVNDNGITISLPGVDRKIISYRDRDVCLQFSFLDSNGNTEYVETQQTTTDSYGMVNLVIGTGTPDAGYSWDNITWTAESKSLKVDVDYGTRGDVSCDNFVGLSVQELTAVHLLFMHQVLKELLVLKDHKDQRVIKRSGAQDLRVIRRYRRSRT